VSAPALYILCSYLGARSTNALDRQYFTFFWFPVEFPVFVMGMLSYSVWKDRISGRLAKTHAEKLVSLTLLLVSGIIFLAGLPTQNGTLYLSSFAFLPLQLALLVRPWQPLVNPVTRYLGKISYSMYLLHILLFPFLVHALNHYAPGFFAGQVLRSDMGVCIMLFVVLAVTLPVCTFTYFFIEQPGIRLGRRLIDWSERRAV
jgi:peptidoglycan/LPS O-acetylase OafA/YrhL